MAFPGWRAHVMIGQESTWATPATPTDALEIVNVRPLQAKPLLQEDTFRGRSAVDFFRSAESVVIELETELRYEGYELLWRYLFDKDTITTVAVTAKQHVIEFDDTATNNKGLTVEVKYGTAAAQALRFHGCLVDEAELVYDIDKIVRVRWRLIGQTGAIFTPVASPTFPTAPRIRWNEVLTERDDVSREIISASVRISNNLITDRRELGNEFILEPLAQERTLEATLRAYLDGSSPFTPWQSLLTGDTTFKLEINATSPTTIAGSSPGTPYSMLLEIPTAKMDPWEAPIPDRSPVIQEFGLKATKVSAELAKLTITNLRATVP